MSLVITPLLHHSITPADFLIKERPALGAGKSRVLRGQLFDQGLNFEYLFFFGRAQFIHLRNEVVGYFLNFILRAV